MGPLPEVEGYRYCLTLIDRFSRWTEAVPLKEVSAQTVSRVFFDNWVSRYGAPEILTTDQGAQFESQLFNALLILIDCQRIRTSAYHPSSNGMIERWHRTLKAALMCHADKNWFRQLSTVLMGLRTHVRLDTGASPAEYLYGTVLRIPGEVCLDNEFVPDPHVFVEEFREHMRRVRPIPVTHKHKKRAFVFKDLAICSHVFLRVGMIKRSLERPYTGPHKVLERIDDYNFKIEVNGTPRVVSTEHLKPAYFIPEDLDVETSGSRQAIGFNAEQRSQFRTYAPKKVVINTAANTVRVIPPRE